MCFQLFRHRQTIDGHSRIRPWCVVFLWADGWHRVIEDSVCNYRKSHQRKTDIPIRIPPRVTIVFLTNWCRKTPEWSALLTDFLRCGATKTGVRLCWFCRWPAVRLPQVGHDCSQSEIACSCACWFRCPRQWFPCCTVWKPARWQLSQCLSRCCHEFLWHSKRYLRVQPT